MVKISNFQIVIPMAGKGVRFRQAGFKQPKALIMVDGKPMIEYVTNLFHGEKDFLYICNTSDFRNTGLRKELQVINPTGEIISIPYQKKGVVYTVMKVQKYINDKSPVVVNYCDFNMYWNYKAFNKFVIQQNLDGCIVCYKGFHPHLLNSSLYAGVRVDNENNFLEIKEKYSFTPNKMDCWQSNGTYYFKSGQIMKHYFNELINKKITCNGEYYVSLVYNLMYMDGLKIKIYPIDFFCQWGTPEDLNAYNYWSEIFKKI